MCKEYTDPLLAVKLYGDWIKYCDGSTDCLRQGTRWSLIYSINSIILSLLCLTFILFAIGSKVFICRLIAACMNEFLGCAHIGAIIMALVLRFRSSGRVASHCTDSAQWKGEGVEMGETTFENDGLLIVVITLAQFFLCFGMCCLGSLPLRMKPRNMAGLELESYGLSD